MSIYSPLILIVDDIPENLMLLEKILHKHQYEVIKANSGIEALDLISAQHPDLILLDISMPEMNGFEVCEKLKQNEETADIPVIFLTASVDINEIIKGFETGAVDYISKPFNPKELIIRVKTQIDLQNSKKLLEVQNKELIKLNDMKNKFFSIIAHDLRGPFTSTLMMTKLVIDEKDKLEKEKIVNFTEKVYQSLKGQFDLLENLLDWSRIQTGILSYTPEQIEVNEHIINTIDLLKNQAGIKEITLNFNSNQNKIELETDKFMLSTILRNFITNAIKFSHQGTNIDIVSTSTDNSVSLSVKDYGLGLSNEDLNKLFKIDTKNVKLGTAKEKGTGLGLVLCKEMVDKMGGIIEVNSEPNLFTEFKVTLNN